MTASRGLQKHPRRGEIAAFIEEAVAYTGSECLLWPFQRNALGYGLVDFRTQGGHRLRAHRIVCERVHGAPLEDRPHAAHSCGNPSCVAPKHLRWASQRENLADRVDHGTMTRGTRQGHSKLTEQDVIAIRALSAEGMGAKNIAKRYGVRWENIRSIIRRDTWAWL